MESQYVDGSLGTKFVEGFAKYQRKLGDTKNPKWTAKDCDGIPGAISLTALMKTFETKTVKYDVKTK